jgi:hypothetical protein
VTHANAQAEERIKEESSNCEASYKDTLAKLEQALNFALIENHMESLQATFKSMLTADKQQGESHSTLTYDRGTHARSLWCVWCRHDAILFFAVASGQRTHQQCQDLRGARRRAGRGDRQGTGLQEDRPSCHEVCNQLHPTGTAPPSFQVQRFAHTVALLTNAQRAIGNQTAELYAKYSAQVNQCFLKNSSFKEAFDKAFVTIMNLSAGKFTTSRHVSVPLCRCCVRFFSGEHRLTVLHTRAQAAQLLSRLPAQGQGQDRRRGKSRPARGSPPLCSRVGGVSRF